MPLIIFNCDGVLADSEVIAHGLLAEMMIELGQSADGSDEDGLPSWVMASARRE